MIFLGKNDKEVPTVKKFKTLITGFINTRLGFIITLLFCYWLKTLWAYHTDFSLDLGNAYQVFLTIINPIPLALLLLGFALYIKNTRAFYISSWVAYIILNLLLISNSIYYREFSDFITVSAMLASSKVSAGLGDSALNLLRIWDIVYILDFIILISLTITKKIKKDHRPFNKRAAFAVTALSSLLL
ncbi:LTA synthase family protein, partial [Streptococcus pyogenes]